MAGPGNILTRSIRKAYFALMIVLPLSAIHATDARAGTTVVWDFTQGLHGWRGNQHTEGLAATTEGLALRSTGIDPWIEGPPVDLAGAGMARVTLRMKSQADAGGELFYGRTFQAGRSVRFTIVNDGQWHEYSLIISEPLGAGTRLRLDPAAGEGQIVVASIQIETLATIEPPQFEKPQRHPENASRSASIRSGNLRLEHRRDRWGAFIVTVDDQEMAVGYDAELIGVVLQDKPQWLSPGKGDVICTVEPDGAIQCRAALKDSEGAQWRVTRRFHAGPQTETITVETEFIVDQDRDVVHVPWLTLFPGLGTFGSRKTQGLFAGLEYLDDEPSSSEADIMTREHVRRCPDPVKVTLPLMAIAQEGRYVGLVWEPSDNVQPVFDSPDTIYGSGAHVLALTGPAVGERRFENELVAHTPLRLRANEPIRTRATIVGGKGATVVSAVQKYVSLRGLPAVPEFDGGFDAAVTLLSHGWLDSAINEGGLFRHAVWGESFKAGPAADAVMYMDWLANHAKDPDLVGRLVAARDLAISRMPASQPYASTVSHTRTPTAPFVFGGLLPYVNRRSADAESLLARFDEQGIKPYSPGDVDYGRTHFARHANGYAAPDVASILHAATLSADPDLIRNGLALLDRQTALYANTVPRGAQTWEVPLHTPDILASAYLVKAYTLGYILSGRREHLEQARYWAWTGVPFVYLANPTAGKVGPYATIAVLGATNWQAPSWFGRPVQWCGLVYGSALHLLAQYDSEGPWQQIAKGITAAGLQMTWPTSDEKRQGLLPDFFHLRAQISDGPAINPGTVQAHVPELFGRGCLYDMRKVETHGWFIHAPCRIHDLREQKDMVTFIVDGWDGNSFYVLVSGVAGKPKEVTLRRTSGGITVAQPDFRNEQRLLVIPVTGVSEVQIRL